MNPAHAAAFPLAPGLVMLNHASFGIPTNEVVALAERTRAELEADSLALVDVEALAPRIASAAAAGADLLGVAPDCFALTQNATSGGAALMRSLRIPAGGQVVVLSTEYASITRGWQVRCEEEATRFVPIRVPLPLASADQLLDVLEANVVGEVAVAQMSLVSSSSAIHFPVAELAAWFRARGALVLVDAAHGPGHVGIDPAAWGCDAIFGTMHKWIPTPRPVGFLWVAERLLDVVRPGEVSLTWDAPRFSDRFAWPGTYDPAPRLCLAAAIEQWRAWELAGDHDRCVKLAEYATAALEEAGAISTSAAELRPPRLRAAVLPGVDREPLRDAMDEARIRCFTGYGPEGQTMIRLATHVYNDEGDIDRCCDVVRTFVH